MMMTDTNFDHVSGGGNSLALMINWPRTSKPYPSNLDIRMKTVMRTLEGKPLGSLPNGWEETTWRLTSHLKHSRQKSTALIFSMWREQMSRSQID